MGARAGLSTLWCSVVDLLGLAARLVGMLLSVPLTIVACMRWSSPKTAIGWRLSWGTVARAASLQRRRSEEYFAIHARLGGVVQRRCVVSKEDNRGEVGAA